MAESNLTFSSLLSRFRPPAGSSQSTQPSRPNGSGAKPAALPNSEFAVGRERPSVATSSTSTAPRPTPPTPASATSPSSTLRFPANASPTSATRDPASGGGQPVKRRKLEGPPKSKPLTEAEKEQLERKKRLMETMRLKRVKEAAAASTTTSAQNSSADATQSNGQSTNTTQPMKKESSYQAMLAKAKEKYTKSVGTVGTITHKSRAPLEKKRFPDKKAPGGDARDRKSKSPSAATGKGATAAGKKSVDPAKSSTIKKVAANGVNGDPRASASKSATNNSKRSDKGDKALEPTVKRNRDPPKSYSSKYSSYASYPTTQKRKRYYEEDEDDDWIVDDEEGDGGGGRYRSKYRYVESDYDSADDMEADGLDILEEEEQARKIAIREDLEEERREKELAARKAAMKRMKR